MHVRTNLESALEAISLLKNEGSGRIDFWNHDFC